MKGIIMKPLRDLVIIELKEEGKEKDTGGLIIQAPRWAKPQNIAKVVSKGPEVTDVDEGNYVLINPYAYQDTAEKNIKIIKQKDILCLAEDQKQG